MTLRPLWIGLILAAPFQVFGMLAPPPDSYLLLSRDQSSCLVMSRSAWTNRWGDDAGRWATLPDGRRLDLYTQFPSNGVYRLPDLAPVYFLDWFADSNRFAISPNLEAIAKFNIYAVHGNPTNAAAPKPKAIRFIKQGLEVRSYLAADLVENPAGGTVPPDEYSSTIFWAWLDSFQIIASDRLEVKTVRRGLFFYGHELSISRGNRLVFDLRSGEILTADRPLGRLRHWIALGLALAIGLGFAVFVLKRSRPSNVSL